MTILHSVGLRFRMWLLGAVTFLPVLALVIYLAWYETRETIGNERKKAEHLADLLVRDQAMTLALARQTLEGLSAVLAAEGSPDPKRCGNSLTKAAQTQAFMKKIGLYSASGEVICSSGGRAPEAAGGAEYLHQAVRLKRAVVSDFVIGKTSRESMVVLALPLLDEQGDVKQVLAAAIGLDSIARELSEVPVAPGTNIVIVDSRGTVLAPHRWSGSTIGSHPVFKRVSGITRGIVFENRGIDGIERIFVARPLDPSLTGTSYLWIAIPKKSAAAAVLRALLGGTLLVVTTVFAMFVIIWWRGTKLVLEPVEQLRMAALRLGKSELSARTNLAHMGDAIGQLAYTFDEMAASIEQRERDLERSRHSLTRSNRALRVLSATHRATIDAKGQQALIGQVCRIGVTLGGYRSVLVGRAGQHPDQPITVLASFGVADDAAANVKSRGADRVIEGGPTAAAVREGRAIVAHGCRSAESGAKADHGSALALPVFLDGGVWGALTVFSLEADAFDDGEVLLLQEVAGALGFGVETLRLRAAKANADAALRSMNEQLEQRVAERTRALEKANAQLAYANKELEAFSYSASHDLQAPLRAVAGFSEALEKDYGDSLPAEGRDYLSRIQLAARRMSSLIQNLLELARVSQVAMEVVPVDLSRMGAEVVAELTEQDPDRRVRVAIAPDMTTRADPRLMRVVLQNLLGNAWKYTARRADAEIHFGIQPGTSGEQVFVVQDNGAGFDMARAQRLFTPFFRMHRAEDFPGSGIGLATVERILTRHGGRIWAHAEKGNGASFHFVVTPHGEAACAHASAALAV